MSQRRLKQNLRNTSLRLWLLLISILSWWKAPLETLWGEAITDAESLSEGSRAMRPPDKALSMIKTNPTLRLFQACKSAAEHGWGKKKNSHDHAIFYVCSFNLKGTQRSVLVIREGRKFELEPELWQESSCAKFQGISLRQNEQWEQRPWGWNKLSGFHGAKGTCGPTSVTCSVGQCSPL